MIRIHLSDREAGRLEQAFLQATDRKLRDRLQIVRLAHRGRKHPDIAADLGVTPAAVRQSKSRVLRRLKEVLGEREGPLF